MPECFSSLSKNGGSPVAGGLVYVFAETAPELCGWEQRSEGGRGHVGLHLVISGSLPV